MGCRYCLWGTKQKIRYYSLNRIKKDLGLILKQKNIDMIYFCDSNIFFDKKRAKTILEYIINKNSNIYVYYELNAEFIDDQIIDLISKSPNHMFNFGIQSITKEALKIMNRKFNKKEFEEKIKKLCRKVPNCLLSFDLMYGLPGDTLEGYKNSLNYALSFNPYNINMFHTLILPGCKFYRNSKKYKIKFQKNPSFKIISTEKFPQNDILKASKLSMYVDLTLYNPYIRNWMYILDKEAFKDGIKIPYLQSIINFFKYLQNHIDITFGKGFPSLAQSF